MNKLKYLLVIFSLLIPLTVSGAKLYKWVDDEGNVHFSDQPGQGKSERITVNPAKPDPVTQQRVEKLLDSQQEAQEDRNVEKEDQMAAQQKQAKRQHNCNIMRDRMKQLNQEGRLYRENEKGEREYLDEEERAARMEKTQQGIDEWCD